MLRIGIHLCLVVGAFALHLEPGLCPSIPYQDKFIPSKLTGRWYKYLYADYLIDRNSTCQSVDITPFVNDTTNIIFFDHSAISKQISRVVVEAHFDHSRISNQLHAPGFGIFENELHILDTDYDNYFIIIGCEEFGNQHLLQVWVDTRDVNPRMDLVALTKRVMRNYGFRSIELAKVDNNNCGFQFYSNTVRRF